MAPEVALPRCPECGTRLQMIEKPGRQRELVSGHYFSVPDDFQIPTCVACGEEVMYPEVSEKLDALLLPSRLRIFGLPVIGWTISMTILALTMGGGFGFCTLFFFSGILAGLCEAVTSWYHVYEPIYRKKNEESKT